MESNQIFITTQFEGKHCWPDAPEQVAFLRDMHRHMFHVKVTVSVFHDDREIEFITLKSEVNAFIQDQLALWPEYISCEMMAEHILTYLMSVYGINRDYCIEVNEDGENGAIIYR